MFLRSPDLSLNQLREGGNRVTDNVRIDFLFNFRFWLAHFEGILLMFFLVTPGTWNPFRR
jgi:hypothetical protein